MKKFLIALLSFYACNTPMLYSMDFPEGGHNSKQHGQPSINSNKEHDQNNLTVIWYPATPFLGIATIGHTEIMFKDTIYNIKNTGAAIRSNFNFTKQWASQGNGAPFMTFEFKLSPLQSQKLNEELSAIKTSGTCASKTSYILNKYTGYSIPLVCRFMPSLMALYLCTAKYCGSRKISSINYFGDGTIASKIGSCARGIVSELVLATSLFSLPYFLHRLYAKL
jgi:hypothetical protein